MTLALVAADLLEACGQDGCPICRLTDKAVREYLRSIFYMQINDVDLRQDFRDRLGFCQAHARVALQPGNGDALGFAILYHDLFTNLLRRLPDGLESQPGSRLPALIGRATHALKGQLNQIVQSIRPAPACPICVYQQNSSNLFVTTFLSELQHRNMLAAFSASQGLCLPHLREALENLSDPQIAGQLLAISRQKYAALDGELSEFIRKNDYRFHDENPELEGDSWRRAVEVFAGK